MIIYQSGILTLDYDPATDILFVEWPDMQHVVLPEIKQALKVLVDHVRNHDIKRLLIDSSKANIDLDGDDYKELLKEFGMNIMSTRLQKLARVLTADKNRERQVEQAKQEIGLTVELKSFTDREEALNWLKSITSEKV